MTAGCAVCHSHKFDPISQREFYQLAAFFNNTTQQALDGNVPDTPPIVTVPRPDDSGSLDCGSTPTWNCCRQRLDRSPPTGRDPSLNSG